MKREPDRETCSQQSGHDPARIREARRGLVDDASAARLADIFAALADPTRLRLLSALAQTELCVGDLAGLLEMSVSAVSHQLRSLRDLRIVRRRRAGRHVYYALDDEHVHELFQRGLEHVRHE